MKETVKIIGFCSKYIRGQGWTTEVPIKYLEQIGYVNLNNIIEQGELVSKDWHDEQVMQAENRIAELEKENDEQYKSIMELEQDLVHADENVFYRECNVTLRENEIREQAIKQFVERLKDIHCEAYLKKQLHGCIDLILKEFMDAKHK